MPDEDILRTYLVNKEDDTIPEIPIKSRAAGLRAKLGTRNLHLLCVIFNQLKIER